MLNEKIIDTVKIDGVEFTIIEKPKTLYAGFHNVAPDIESEPDFGDTYNRFQQGHTKIIDSTTPECMIALSIGYTNWHRIHDAKREAMNCKETTNPNQPNGIKVIEAPPCLLIRVKSTDEVWALTKKITGLDYPGHMSPLFGLMGKLFFTPEHGFTADGKLEMEYYNFDGNQYAAIPVKKI